MAEISYGMINRFNTNRRSEGQLASLDGPHRSHPELSIEYFQAPKPGFEKANKWDIAISGDQMALVSYLDSPFDVKVEILIILLAHSRNEFRLVLLVNDEQWFDVGSTKTYSQAISSAIENLLDHQRIQDDLDSVEDHG